jgi:hypothetical protein
MNSIEEKTMKIIRVTLLVMALACSTYAGDIPNDVRVAGDIPNGVTVAGDIPYGVTLLNLLTLILP